MQDVARRTLPNSVTTGHLHSAFRSGPETHEWTEIPSAEDCSPLVVQGWSPPPDDPFPYVDIDLKMWEAARTRVTGNRATQGAKGPGKPAASHRRASSTSTLAAKKIGPGRAPQKESNTEGKDKKTTSVGSSVLQSSTMRRPARSSRSRPSRPKKPVSLPPRVDEIKKEADSNDNDLNMNVDIPPYVYPDPRLARLITKRAAAEDRARAAFESEMLQEHFRAEGEAPMFTDAYPQIQLDARHAYGDSGDADVDALLVGTLEG